MAGPMVATLQVRLRNWNSWVCRPYSTQASLCLAGKTCSAVFEGGVGSAFKNDQSLQSLLAPLQQLPTNGITMPTDAQACSEWIQSRGRPVLGNLSTALQNDEFCQCMVTCDTACGVADERTGFEWVAWCFATWSLVTMLICVKMVKERPTAGRTSSPPMVPAMFNTLQNGPFRVLLPAWAMDAYCNAIVTSVAPYFAVIVIAPTYQEGCGDPSSDSYDQWFCDTGNVIVVCGVLVLLAAIVGLPFWHTMVRMIGKVRTWWLWSLTMALTNLLFMFLLEGWVIPFWIVSALNGFPLGAKFIADSILSDIIDYDEFLTGHRSEATYFMFKGFLPKIVQIPASAVPIALLGLVGYKSPVGGVEQRQGMSVVIYIKAVVFSCVIASSIAVLIKWRYPLRTAEHRNELQRGIEAHRRSEDYPDPVTKVSYRLMKVSGELQNTYWLLDHFRAQRLRRAFVEQAKQESREAAELLAAINLKEGARRILRITRYQLFASIVALVTSVVATIFSMRLLSDKNFSFVPTFTAVAVGLSIVALVFSSLRLRAAVRLEASANSGDLTEQIVAQVLLRRDLIGQVGMLRSEHRDSLRGDCQMHGSLEASI
uniref:Uncharacterized protein n=1 Tax=Pyrodinium bahamense TaxID=73915 RepID=A0A7S0AD22_9DINO